MTKNKEMTGTIQECEGNLWIDGEVDENFDEALKQIGLGNKASVIVREHHEHQVAELCIDVGGGQAVVRSDDNMIEFDDCLPISIDDLKYVIDEASAFIEYRDERNSGATRQRRSVDDMKHLLMPQKHKFAGTFREM